MDKAEHLYYNKFHPILIFPKGFEYMEWIISGYCRGQDQARSILLEYDRGQWYCDCDYPDCPYAVNCPVGSEIHAKQQEVSP